MAFERLSNEILIEIVEYASVEGSISSWWSLASVNRTLNSIVTPMLYSSFREENRTSVPKLLRTVLSNSQLATYVRTYTGYGISNEPSPETHQLISILQQPKQMAEAGHLCQEGEFLDVSDLEDDDFDVCREILNWMEFDPGRIDDWMSRICEGKWHALTSLLLILLPNLEDVEMIDYRYDLEGDIEHALGEVARLQVSGIESQFILEHLSNISLSAFIPPEDGEPYGFGQRQERDYLYFVDVMPFLLLPSVESVVISGLSSEDGPSYEASILPKDINFGTKDLEINNSCPEGWWMIGFLRFFTSLRRFSYNHVSLGQEPDFLPQEIGKALAHLRPCLEELEITYMCEESGAYTTPMEIGSLAGFERLKSINVDGSILFGYPNAEDGSMPVLRLCDILPGALESLVTSSSDCECHEEHLRELLRVKEERFPKLKRVEMKWLGRSLDDPKGLKKEFKAKGVKLLLGL